MSDQCKTSCDFPKNRFLQRRHRHGTIPAPFRIHSSTPCLLDRRISVEPQSEHCNDLLIRVAEPSWLLLAEAGSGCLGEFAFNVLPNRPRSASAIARSLKKGTTFRVASKGLVLRKCYFITAAFGTVDSFMIRVRSRFHSFSHDRWLYSSADALVLCEETPVRESISGTADDRSLHLIHGSFSNSCASRNGSSRFARPWAGNFCAN